MTIKFIGASTEDTATLEECVEFCSKQSILGIDVETQRRFSKNQYVSKVYKPGLDPYLSRVCMLQIGTEEVVYVIDTRRVSIEPLREVLESEDILKVTHNGSFEYRHILVNFNIRLANLYDTMLVEIILTNGLKMGYGLADLAIRYFGAKKVENLDLFNMASYSNRVNFDEWIYDQEATIYLDKSTRLGFIEIGDRPFSTKQIEYGADDVLLPLRIREKQLQGAFNYVSGFERYKEMAQGWFPKGAIDLEHKFLPALAEIQVKGMHFRGDIWLKTYEEALPVYYRRMEALNNWVIENHPEFVGTSDLFSGKGTCAIKWSSSTQVVKFFRHLEICPKERSKSTRKLEFTVGATSVFKQLTNEYKGYYAKGKEVDITDNQSFQLMYLLFKKSEQAVTTFGKSWLKYVHPITKRVHSSYRQILHTGRMSSVAPNLQNPPTAEGYRGAFVAPPGFKVVNTDYSSQEVRVLAYVSGVQAMKDFFILGDPTWGDDYHSYTATRVQRILKNDPTYLVPPKEIDGEKNPAFTAEHGEVRTKAKSVTFKLAYGGSPFSLKDELGISLEEAEAFFGVYFKAFPGLEEDFYQRKKAAIKNGYVEIDPITQRRWWCPFLDEMNKLEELAWSYYPSNYKTMGPEERANTKVMLKAAHPELSGIWSDFMRLKGQLERTALNYPIQGLASSQMKRAVTGIYNRLKKAGYLDRVYLNNIIHDETNAIAEEGLAEHAATLIKQEMERAGSFFCPGMPMTATPAITNYWKH